MTKKRPGFHDMFVQIPDAVWQALSDEADKQGRSITHILTEVLCKRFKIPSEAIPKPKRAGRKPRQPE